MSKVFVVHPIKFDISIARKFGELTYINRRYIYGDELEQDDGGASLWTLPAHFVGNMVQARNCFRSGTDYVLIVGDHLQLMAFVHMVLSVNQYVDVLRYDRKIPDYIPIRMHTHIVQALRSVLPSSFDIGDQNAEDRDQGHAEIARSQIDWSTDDVRRRFEGKR